MISPEHVKKTKIAAIILVILAVLTFIVGSTKIYAFSIEEPVTYQLNLQKLTKPEKVVANSMYATGKTTWSVSHSSNTRSKKSFDLFDDISRQHKSR